MATEVERLAVAVEANTKEFNRALKKIDTDFVAWSRKLEREGKRIDSTFNGVAMSLGNITRGLAGMVGIAGVGATFATISQGIKDLAEIGDLADRIGMTTDQVQELAYGAVQANIDFQDLATGLQRFSRNVGEAARGQGDLLEVLQANNIPLRDLNGNLRPLNDLLRDYAELVRNAANEQDQMVLAMAGFGKAGAPFIEFLRDGRGGLDGFAQAARDAGAVVDSEVIARAQEFDDAWAAAVLRAKANVANFLGSIKFDWNAQGAPGRAGTPNLPVTISDVTSNQSAKGDLLPIKPKGKPTTIPVKPEKSTPNRKREFDFNEQILGQLNSEIALIETRNANYGKSEGVQKSAETRQRIMNQMAREGVQLTAAQTAALETYLAQLEQVTNQSEEIERQARAWEQVRQSAGDALGQIVVDGNSAKTVLNNLVKQLIAAAFQAQLMNTGPLAGLFGGGGGLLGNLFGLPKRALGGPVAAGMPYQVGERGPEVFVPSLPGVVLPNNFKARGGASSVVHYNSYHYSFSPGMRADEVQEMIEAANEASRAQDSEQSRRGRN